VLYRKVSREVNYYRDFTVPGKLQLGWKIEYCNVLKTTISSFSEEFLFLSEDLRRVAEKGKEVVIFAPKI
jgi:hypothetical protein